MARPASKYPTELELEILKVLWRHGPLTGLAVRDALAPERDLAYTSVMTILGIMLEKGYVARRKSGARFLYRARIGEQATARGMLRDLVSRVYDGSVEAVLVSLLESSGLDREEIQRLRQLLSNQLLNDNSTENQP